MTSRQKQAFGHLTMAMLSLVSAYAAVFADDMAIVQNGEASAKIILPRSALPVVVFAADELQYHLHKSSGAQLSILKENELQDVNGPLIFLGDCDAAVKAGIPRTWPSPNSF